MIEIRYLQAESGANKFGTCNCCGKSSGEDPLMISIKFSYYGHGTLICLCDDCKKELMEALPHANTSETPNSSDTISRAKAIDAVKRLSLGETDAMRLAMRIGDYLERLSPAQLGTNLAEVGTDCISRQAVLDALNNIEIPRNASWYQYYQQALTAVDKLPPAQPEQLEQCHIYGGMCAYPSDQCYDCPRHAGAKMGVTE